MDDGAVRRVIEAGAQAAIPKPFVIEGPGFKKLAACQDDYPDANDDSPGPCSRTWTFTDLPLGVVAAPEIKLQTLTGFSDYINANRDQLDHVDVMVIVRDPGTVVLMSRIIGEDVPTRHTVAVASFEELVKPNGVRSMAEFSFGQWYPPAHFNVSLQCLFLDTPERARVLEAVGDVRSQGVTTYEDDGITQGIVASSGVKLGRLVPVPNPVTLAPFRTFREIDQPESKFVLRMRGEPQEIPEIALFEADGGAWRLVAVQRIAEFLKTRLPADVSVIA